MATDPISRYDMASGEVIDRLKDNDLVLIAALASAPCEVISIALVQADEGVDHESYIRQLRHILEVLFETYSHLLTITEPEDRDRRRRAAIAALEPRYAWLKRVEATLEGHAKRHPRDPCDAGSMAEALFFELDRVLQDLSVLFLELGSSTYEVLVHLDPTRHVSADTATDRLAEIGADRWGEPPFAKIDLTVYANSWSLSHASAFEQNLVHFYRSSSRFADQVVRLYEAREGESAVFGLHLAMKAAFELMASTHALWLACGVIRNLYCRSRE